MLVSNASLVITRNCVQSVLAELDQPFKFMLQLNILVSKEKSTSLSSQLSQCILWIFNSLTNDKIMDWSKFKAFADDKLNVPEKLKFVSGRVENIAGKGENAGYQHFLLFSSPEH